VTLNPIQFQEKFKLWGVCLRVTKLFEVIEQPRSEKWWAPPQVCDQMRSSTW
jgi:hypothetical protein